MSKNKNKNKKFSKKPDLLKSGFGFYFRKNIGGVYCLTFSESQEFVRQKLGTIANFTKIKMNKNKNKDKYRPNSP